MTGLFICFKIRNPNTEIRNKFEYQMIKISIQRSKVKKIDSTFLFVTFENLNFDIVSIFEFRASNF